MNEVNNMNEVSNMNEVIENWVAAKNELAALQKVERELRAQIAETVLEGKLEGSKTSIIGDWKLSATAVINYTVDSDALELRKAELSAADWAAMTFKPTVVASKLKKLSNDSVLHKIVSAKPGMAQLKVIEVFE